MSVGLLFEKEKDLRLNPTLDCEARRGTQFESSAATVSRQGTWGIMKLIARHITVSIDSRLLLDHVSIEIPTGTITALLGPNGAGKTTLLNVIGGFLPPTSRASELYLNDEPLMGTTPEVRTQKGIASLSQHSILFESLTARDNLAVVFQYHPLWRDKTRAEFDTEVTTYARLTGIEKSLETRAGLLSGGQKRKLEIIRALLCHPTIIITDEPFAGVDPKSITEIGELFLTLAAEKNIGFCISDHNIEQLLRLSNSLYVMMGGKIIVAGSREQILNDEYTRLHYFGSSFHATIHQNFSLRNS